MPVKSYVTKTDLGKSPEKRPPSLYSQTPNMKDKTSAKAYQLQGTPGLSQTIERGGMKIYNPMDGPGPSNQQAYLNSQLNGSKSTKQFQRMGDGISGVSVSDPIVMNSARRPPMPVTNKFETRSRSSAQIKTMDAVTKRSTAASMRGGIAASPMIMHKSNSSKTMGVNGYYCQKVGLPKREPNYTIPRDENQNFFKHVTRATKGVPGPNHYERGLSWKTPSGNFGLGPKRTTFTDDAAKLSKQIPSAATYKPDIKSRLLLGHMSKTEGVNYLSDHQYLAARNPGPTTYEGDFNYREYEKKGEMHQINVSNKTDLFFYKWIAYQIFFILNQASRVKPRILAVKIDPNTKGKKSWRPVKVKEPDCASYEYGPSKDFVSKSPFIHKFAMPKEAGVKQTNDTFTTQATKRKKYVPGVGSYTPKTDFVCVPYGRKRL